MSVLTQVLTDLSARGAQAPASLLDPAWAPTAPVGTLPSAMPTASRRGPSKRQWVWLATLLVVAGVVGSLTWMEVRAGDPQLSGKPRGLAEFGPALPLAQSQAAPERPREPAAVAESSAPAVAAAPLAPPRGGSTDASMPNAPAPAPAALAAVPAKAPAAMPPRIAGAGTAGSTKAVNAPAEAPQGASQASVQRSSASANDPRNDVARAASLIARGRSSEAMPLLRDVLARDPSHATARSALAALQSEAGERAAALATLYEGVLLDPAAFAIPAAKLQVELGDARGAMATLQRLPADRRDETYFALAGGIALAADAPAAAIEAYERALRGRSPNPVWWIGLGLAYEASGRNADAHAAYARLAQRPELDADVRQFLQQKLAATAPASPPPGGNGPLLARP